MNVPVSEAKGQLTDLVRRAEGGEDIVLTRHGQPAVRLVPVRGLPDEEARQRIIEAVQASARGKLRPGADAARSQDFLYDEDGLPK